RECSSHSCCVLPTHDWLYLCLGYQPLLLRHVRLLFRYPHFFFNDTPTTEIYTLSLHDALPICRRRGETAGHGAGRDRRRNCAMRSEEHTSELQSPDHLVCRLLLEKKKKKAAWRAAQR